MRREKKQKQRIKARVHAYGLFTLNRTQRYVYGLKPITNEDCKDNEADKHDCQPC